MAGHSHASNVAVRKGKQDAKRAQAFAKMSKLIMVAARSNPDTGSNFTLRHIVEKAKAISMPKDKIEHAIKKGGGLLEGQAQLETIIYEGYAPGGSAIMVECLTDNPHRTAPLIRNIMDRNNGKLGTSGCVAYMFRRVGLFVFEAGANTEDTIFEAVVEAGAENLENLGGGKMEVICPVDRFQAVDEALQKKGIQSEVSELSWITDDQVALSKEDAEKTEKLIELLDECEDTNNIFTNADLSALVAT
ncbi:MAG: YebC/PmpR family DNA-binding transcriptional regulator [Planctomycetota bacterium]